MLKITLDVSASYPSNGAALNISKATTWREIVNIEGVNPELRKLAGLNLSGGRNNSIEIVTSIYKAPQLDEWLKAFIEDEQTIDI